MDFTKGSVLSADRTEKTGKRAAGPHGSMAEKPHGTPKTSVKPRFSGIFHGQRQAFARQRTANGGRKRFFCGRIHLFRGRKIFFRRTFSRFRGSLSLYVGRRCRNQGESHPSAGRNSRIHGQNRRLQDGSTRLRHTLPPSGRGTRRKCHDGYDACMSFNRL